MRHAATDFTAFYRREHDRLYRALCLVLDDRQLASEAVDEAMTRAWERWQRVQHYEDPAGWVLRVARNWASSWRRKWGRRPTRPAEELDRAVDDDLADLDLWRALAALPQGQREAVVLRYVLDWPAERVAVALRIAPGTVRSRAHRGVRTLEAMAEAIR